MRTARLAILLVLPLVLATPVLAQESPGEKPEEPEKPEAPPPDIPKLLVGEAEMGEGRTVRIEYDFEGEAQLHDWERVGEAVKIGSGRVALEEGAGLLHRLPFAGSMKVELKARRMRSLSIELASNGESEGTGYRVVLTPGKPGTLAVYRALDTWAEREVDISGPRSATFALEKGAVVFAVDGEEVFRQEEPEPLGGTRILVGAGGKGLQVEDLVITGGWDPAAIAAAKLVRPLPKDTWVEFMGESGLDDFYSGRGWKNEKGTIVYRGGKGDQAWCVFRDVDTGKLESYVLEGELMTDSPRWSKRGESGWVWVSFSVAGLDAAWVFTNVGSQLRDLDATRTSMSIARKRWHRFRIVVKGERAEGFLDGKRAWSLGGTEGLNEFEDPKRRFFGFGGERGPMSFRNFRVMVTD